MPFDPDKPYNDLTLPPPKLSFETKAVLRKAIVPNKARAELKSAARSGMCLSNHEIEASEHVFAKRTYCENMSKKPDFSTYPRAVEGSYGFR